MRISGSISAAFVGSFALFALVVIYLNRNGAPDDAFIYLRTAENIAAGHGWSFNSGQTFNATTSALQTIVLAGVIRLGVGGPDAMWITYGAWLAVAGAALHFGLRRQAPIASIAAPLLIVSWSIVWRSIGMETAAMFALVACAALALKYDFLFLAGPRKG